VSDTFPIVGIDDVAHLVSSELAGTHLMDDDGKVAALDVCIVLLNDLVEHYGGKRWEADND